MSTQSFSVTSDSELTSRVRTITGYDDTSDEVPQSDMTDLVDVAKADVFSETDTTEWYSDHHMGEVLVYTLCVKAKLRVENYSVSQWSLGNESVTTLNAVPDEEGQLQFWIGKIEDNMDDSPVTDEGGSGVAELTSTYNW